MPTLHKQHMVLGYPPRQPGGGYSHSQYIEDDDSYDGDYSSDDDRDELDGEEYGRAVTHPHHRRFINNPPASFPAPEPFRPMPLSKSAPSSFDKAAFKRDMQTMKAQMQEMKEQMKSVKMSAFHKAAFDRDMQQMKEQLKSVKTPVWDKAAFDRDMQQMKEQMKSVKTSAFDEAAFKRQMREVEAMNTWTHPHHPAPHPSASFSQEDSRTYAPWVPPSTAHHSDNVPSRYTRARH
ncbi:hypothetical protein BDZ97DRAFT_462164 [Flammula alnicola]|nr:hypothetical protein BDZ97DRAFT_462164 [Flammula alnicola]